MPARVIETGIPEVKIVEPQVFGDERGFFLESYNAKHYAELGIPEIFVQDNHSRSAAGVLRGLHFQDMRQPQGKLVRCSRGRILDVAVDLRVGSPTFGRYVAAELSAKNMHQLWVPVGFGHGFATLEDGSEVQYKCTSLYNPEVEGAVAWNDPDIGIEWPISDPTLSAKDAAAGSLAKYLENPAFRYER